MCENVYGSYEKCIREQKANITGDGGINNNKHAQHSTLQIADSDCK